MGLFSESNFPHKGWCLIDVIDLREDNGLEYGEYEDCEACDHEQIRFVHILRHDSYHRNIRAGCVCSCKLTEDYVTPKHRERAVRNRAAKRDRFINRKWKDTRYGGKTIKIGEHRATVSEINGCFHVWINSVHGRDCYETERQAMLAAFDFVNPPAGKTPSFIPAPCRRPTVSISKEEARRRLRLMKEKE